MNTELREIKIEYTSGKTSPPLLIEVFHGETDVEIQQKYIKRKDGKRYPTDGVYSIGATKEEALEQFKKLLAQRIRNQDPEKIHII